MPGRRDPTVEGPLRRRLVILAGTLTVLGALHFVDHVVRGYLVVDGGLNPRWNHSGWPFDTDMTSPYIFTASLVGVSALLLGGIAGTLRGRIWAGYWLATSLALAAVLLVVHFHGIPPGEAETPAVISATYADDIRGVLAQTDLYALFALLAVLAFESIMARRRSGRW